MTARTTALLRTLGVELPIIQAPMAGVSSPAMAAAVSEAGGLGSIGVGATTTDGARTMIREVRERTGHPFNVNLFVHRPASASPDREAAWIARFRPEFERLGASVPDVLTEIYTSSVDDDAMLAMLLEERPPIVSLHFGLLDGDRLQALRDAGITIVASATSLAEASVAAASGANAVVAQGWEAGGHRGMFDPDAVDDELGTLALTSVVARALDIPVIAAGGMMDGAGIDASLALGAAAAQLGTAYLASSESLADEGHRAALFSDAAHHTVMTRAISGRPARSLANRITVLGKDIAAAQVPAYPIAYDLGKRLHAAGKESGEFGYGAQWAGQGAPLARRLSAGELTRTLAREMKGR